MPDNTCPYCEEHCTVYPLCHCGCGNPPSFSKKHASLSVAHKYVVGHNWRFPGFAQFVPLFRRAYLNGLFADYNTQEISNLFSLAKDAVHRIIWAKSYRDLGIAPRQEVTLETLLEIRYGDTWPSVYEVFCMNRNIAGNGGRNSQIERGSSI